MREFFQKLIRGFTLQLWLLALMVSGLIFFFYRMEQVSSNYIPFYFKPLVVFHQWSQVFDQLAQQKSGEALDASLYRKIIDGSATAKDFPLSFLTQSEVSHLQKIAWQGYSSFYDTRRREGLIHLRRSFSVHTEAPSSWLLAVALASWQKFHLSHNEEEVELAALSALYLSHLDGAFAERVSDLFEQPGIYQSKTLLQQSQKLLLHENFETREGLRQYFLSREFKSPDQLAIAANIASGSKDLLLEIEFLNQALQSSDFEEGALTRYYQIMNEKLDNHVDLMRVLNFLNQKQPGHPTVSFYLGELYRQRNQKELALSYLNQVPSASDFFDQAQSSVSELLEEQKKYDQAQPLLRELSRRNPASLELKKRLAFNLKNTGDFEKASVIFDMLSELSPNDFEIQFELGQIYLYKMGHLEKAEKHLLRARQLSPQNPQLQKILGDLNLSDQGRSYGN